MIQFFLLFFPRGPQQKNPEFWKIQIIKVNKAEFSLKKKYEDYMTAWVFKGVL